MNDEVLELLKKTKAIYTDSHFVYVSGKHAKLYVNKDSIYPHTAYVSRIAEIIAKKYKDKPVDVVAGPSIGGIILSQWVAHHLSRLKKREVLSVYTEKTPDKNQIFTRGYDKFVKGKNVLVVEDIVTTGGSVKKVIKSVEKAGGKVIAACSMVNKDPEHINPAYIGVPYDYLTIVDTEVFDEKDCPLCKQNIPIDTRVGHGKKYLEEKAKKKR